MADFQTHLSKFTTHNVAIIAGSTDIVETARETIDKLDLTFPIAYGMEAREFARVTGAYFNDRKEYLHAAGFVLCPDGTVAEACYSTGTIGRFNAGDCLELIELHIKKKFVEGQVRTRSEESD